MERVKWLKECQHGRYNGAVNGKGERTCILVASLAVLHGVSGGLELLERHVAVIREEEHVPVLVTHGAG